MRFGLALQQYDYSVQGERPLQFDTIVEYARRAADSGFDSVWLSDHLLLDIGKYGGPPDREACFDPVVTLAALARRVPDVRLGTLVFCEALRPAARLAEAVEVVKGVLCGEPFTFAGAHHRATEASSLPPPQQVPRPRVFVGGKG